MPKATKSPASEAELWARLLEMADAELTEDTARYLLTLQFPEQDIDRMHELAEKARAGTLTRDESADLNVYEQVGHALSLMKSNAGRIVRRSVHGE